MSIMKAAGSKAIALLLFLIRAIVALPAVILVMLIDSLSKEGASASRSMSEQF